MQIGLCHLAGVLYALSPSKMAPRTAWSRGSVLVVAVVGIGNTKQWKTKRLLCVNYQEIFKIKLELVSYSVYFHVFISVDWKSRKCFDTVSVI